MSRATTVRRAALWSIAAQYLAFAAQFVVSVLISRFFLSPAEMGLYSIALSAAMMVSILQDCGITRYIAGERDLDDAGIRTCFSLSVVFALTIGLVILGLSWPVGRFYADPRLTPLMIVIAGSFLIAPFGIVPAAVLQRRMDWRSVFMVNVGAVAINAVVALGLAALGFSALSLAWALVAQQAARAVIGKACAGVGWPFPLRFAGSESVIRFGLKSSLLYVSGAIGTRSPELIVGRLLGLTAVGFFGRASSLAAQLQQLVSGAIDGVFYPVFARLRDEGAPLASPYQRVVAAYTAVTWPAMAFLAASATPIVLMLYGPNWAGAASPLVWIAVAQCFFVALPLHFELPILLGRMRRLMVLNIADTAASVGLLLVGAWGGLDWAAASRVGYGIVWYLLYVGLIRKLTGIGLLALARLYAQSLLATLATVAPLLAAYRWWMPPGEMGILPLATCALIGCGGWVAAIFVARHPLRSELEAPLRALSEHRWKARASLSRSGA